MPDNVISYDANTRFTFISEKQVDAQPDVVWQNSYEFNAVAPGDSANLIGLAQTIAAFEATHLRTVFTITRVRVSTWLPDSHPYDPTSFMNVVVNTPGENVMFGPNMPLTEVLQLYRNGHYGRVGLLDWRGVVNLDNVNPTITGWALDDVAATQAGIDAALVSSGFDAFLGGGSVDLELGMVDKDGAFRPVFELNVGGVQHVKLKHKWFNRS